MGKRRFLSLVWYGRREAEGVLRRWRCVWKVGNIGGRDEREDEKIIWYLVIFKV